MCFCSFDVCLFCCISALLNTSFVVSCMHFYLHKIYCFSFFLACSRHRRDAYFIFYFYLFNLFKNNWVGFSVLNLNSPQTGIEILVGVWRFGLGTCTCLGLNNKNLTLLKILLFSLT